MLEDTYTHAGKGLGFQILSKGLRKGAGKGSAFRQVNFIAQFLHIYMRANFSGRGVIAVTYTSDFIAFI